MSMKIYFVKTVVTMALFAALGQAQAGIQIEKWTQDDGAQVWLASSPNIPMVDVHIEFDAGSRRDPADMSGLAASTAIMMTKGVQAWQSQPARSMAEVGEAWSDLGANFSASASEDYFAFDLRSLTKADILPEAAQLAAQQMAAPSFDQAVANRERDRALAELKEAQTKPGFVAQTAFDKAVYGDSPYGRNPNAESLQKIQTRDMRDFYQRFVRACAAKVSIVGAVNKAEAEALVKTLLAGINDKPCEALPAVADAERLSQAQMIEIPFKAAQAQVLIGQPSMRRKDPAFFPIVLGNYILGGGGFVSRLTEAVREKRGLSYSVYSYFAFGENLGVFGMGLQTRPDQALQAKDVAMDVLKEFVEKGPSEKELKAAKDNLIGGFALRIDSNRKLLDNVANIARFDLPLDYLDHWTGQVAKVSVADIQKAFQEKVQAEHMVTVILGAEGK